MNSYWAFYGSFFYFDWFFSHNGVSIAPIKNIQTILKKLS